METQPKQRIQSIDILRGVVMVIMALDHVRDFYSNAHFNPTDLTQTTPALFFTRFITHYCAPVFVFLSGISAFLGGSKGRTRRQQSLFLLTRGLWLILLELTLVNWEWSFDLSFQFFVLQVIWVIGWSMIVLAGLVWLPPIYAGLFGLVLIAGHNALDTVHGADWGQWSWSWYMLHETSTLPLGGGVQALTLYPLVPWVGVMALGYWCGGLYRQEAAVRRKALQWIGVGAILLFILLRSINVYGDLLPRMEYQEGWKTALSFINVSKYPPSLDYLLITLGPACLLLALLDGAQVTADHPALVFGRVPFFYYLLHILLIHASVLLVVWLTHTHSGTEWTGFPLQLQWPGFSLPVVYLVWAMVVTLLYFPCRWYMKVKSRRKDWWLSYL